MKRIVPAMCATVTVSSAQTFTTLYRFCSQNGCTDGKFPIAGLIQGPDGDLFGTTTAGGVNSHAGGTVFKITPSGTLTSIYSFCAQDTCANGDDPSAPLLPGTDGNLYSTTPSGGPYDGGTIFKISPTGTLTKLSSFCGQTNCYDGNESVAGLVRATDGLLYGTAAGGGGKSNQRDGGTIFAIMPDGARKTLDRFCNDPNCPRGAVPRAAMIQANDGNLYGTTYYGGAQNAGTIFKITTDGALTTLYSFCSETGCADGGYPQGGLVQASNGMLYGATSSYGNSPGGTIFEITTGGTLTTLHQFCLQPGCTDGAAPSASLIQGSDGNLYGTAFSFGVCGSGTIFKITLGGTLTTLYNFCMQTGCRDGASPAASLVQYTNGNFYGTTLLGGTSNGGIVFRLSLGLPPFVGTIPTSGSAGAAVEILGTNLTGATSVTFNSAPAAFQVVSDALITTTVPAGAGNGNVQVVTPAGTLVSNVPFMAQ